MVDEILIAGGYVVTGDAALGDQPGADVLVRDQRIAEIGTDLTATASARIVDARGSIVLPGFVDTHRHMWLGGIGASVPAVSLPDYSRAVMGDFAARYTPADIYAGTLWGALLALNSGVTSVADWAHNLPTPEHADANVRALIDSRIRAVFVYGGPGTPNASDELSPGYAAEVRRLHCQHFATDTAGRLRMAAALRGPSFAGSSATVAEFDLAREFALPISIHAGMAGFPDAVVALQRLGLLGADVNYAHGNCFSAEEYDLIANSGGSIAVSPTVDMTMGLGVYPATGEALSRGIRVGLAADTVASSGTDLFSEMRLALAAERSRANRAAIEGGTAGPVNAVDHRDILKLATAGGAEVWGLGGDVGSLSVGKYADIVIIDMRSPHLDGFGDPALALVLGAGPADVRTVLVGGEIVKHDGHLSEPTASDARRLMHESRRRLHRPALV